MSQLRAGVRLCAACVQLIVQRIVQPVAQWIVQPVVQRIVQPIVRPIVQPTLRPTVPSRAHCIGRVRDIGVRCVRQAGMRRAQGRFVMPMSIAVSAVIHPSRQLRWLHALLCVLVLAAAGAFRQPVPQCVMVGAVFVSACRRRPGVNGVRLDISGVGGMRLAVYQSNAHNTAQQAAAHARDGPEAAAAGQEVWLMPGSTLWPALLLLRLRGGDGTVFWLPVLPDTVAPDVLRRVALAMRAIATRGPPAA